VVHYRQVRTDFTGVCMYRMLLLLVDLVLVALASLAALILRDNLELSQARLEAFAPYLTITTLVAAIVLPAMGLASAVWRFVTFADCLRILGAAVATVVGAVALGFGINRMDGVARALPILQVIFIVVALVGVRMALRLRHTYRGGPAQFASADFDGSIETVLVVGLNRLTELYLRSVAEFGAERVRVAGLLGRNDRHTGRVVLGCPVLGLPEQIGQVLRDQEVHGVFVTRIVVTVPFEQFSPEAREALTDIATSTSIRLQFLSEALGFDGPQTHGSAGTVAPQPIKMAFEIAPEEQAALAKRSYWRVKRLFDFFLALVLLAVLSPVILAVAVLVAFDVGLPVAFWQQRPGLGGRPFWLYKFRTMASAYDGRGRRVPDASRLSVIGTFLRRTRLDELPQIFNILMGKMSFIGPRPLLPVDQPAAYRARLLVRPGLTGWAQVKGGRVVSAADKAALDVWYVRNASLQLDMEIVLRTVAMVIFGEREVNAAAVALAWSELQEAGICKSPEHVAYAAAPDSPMPVRETPYGRAA
jgi:lipopolysaccharide/colanic/teichoic acid biosynthesis glycosyltransferase